MARVCLAWELGANLGHAARLRAVAQALQHRGHEVTLLLRDVVSTRALLGPELGRVLQAPLMLHSGAAPTAWSMADILLSCGYGSAHSLGGLAGAWKGLLELTGCEVLLADHAPTALLAARLAGIPAVHVGHGFFMPPRQSPLPVFRDWARAPESHAEQSDAQALASVNEVLAAGGVPPLLRLCDLFYPEQALLCSWPELDHYAGQGREASAFRGPDCEFSPGVAAAWPEAPGPRVFAYLRAAHPDHAELLQALDALGCSTVCFMPDRAASKAPLSARIHYSEHPVDLRQLLPQCALVVCHAGQSTLAQAVQAGVPCLMLPSQTEQFLVARQLARFGVGINAGAIARPVDYAALITQLTQPQGPHAVAARAMAEKYRGFDPAGLTAQVVAAAEGLCR